MSYTAVLPARVPKGLREMVEKEECPSGCHLQSGHVNMSLCITRMAGLKAWTNNTHTYFLLPTYMSSSFPFLSVSHLHPLLCTCCSNLYVFLFHPFPHCPPSLRSSSGNVSLIFMFLCSLPPVACCPTSCQTPSPISGF